MTHGGWLVGKSFINDALLPVWDCPILYQGSNMDSFPSQSVYTLVWVITPPPLPFILCSTLHLVISGTRSSVHLLKTFKKSGTYIYIYNKAALHSTVDLQSAPHTGKNIKQALCNCIVIYIKFITSHGSSTKSPPWPPYACQLSWHNPAFSMLPIRSCTFWNWTECIFSLFFLP